jgi:hypothetical protein
MSTPIDTRQLPLVITDYLAAHQARDLDPAKGRCPDCEPSPVD